MLHNPVQIKVKVNPQHAMEAQRQRRGLATFIQNIGVRCGYLWRSRSGRFTSGKDSRYPLYRALGGLQSRSRRVNKIWSLPRFEPRTVLPVASRYTDWVIPAPLIQGVTSQHNKQGNSKYQLPASIAVSLVSMRLKDYSSKGKVHPCTGTEALYRPYDP